MKGLQEDTLEPLTGWRVSVNRQGVVAEVPPQCWTAESGPDDPIVGSWCRTGGIIEGLRS